MAACEVCGSCIATFCGDEAPGANARVFQFVDPFVNPFVDPAVSPEALGA
jgi:hypothetical protein